MNKEHLALISRLTNKISRIRAVRDRRLRELDVLALRIVWGDLQIANKERWKQYRRDLLDITEPYKDFVTDSRHRNDLQSLSIRDLVWPDKPTLR